MRRYRTQIEVWPAIADLMTVVAILAFGALMATCSPKGESSGEMPDPEPKAPDPLEEECCDRIPMLEDSIRALESTLTRRENRIIVLEDSIRSLVTDKNWGVGLPPCLGYDEKGQPVGLVAITVRNDSRYYVAGTWPGDGSSREEEKRRKWIQDHDLQDWIDENLSEDEFKAFGDLVDQSGKDECRHWVYLVRDDDVDFDEFRLRWMDDLHPYFNGATNPSVILPK